MRAGEGLELGRVHGVERRPPGPPVPVVGEGEVRGGTVADGRGADDERSGTCGEEGSGHPEGVVAEELGTLDTVRVPARGARAGEHLPDDRSGARELDRFEDPIAGDEPAAQGFVVGDAPVAGEVDRRQLGPHKQVDQGRFGGLVASAHGHDATVLQTGPSGSADDISVQVRWGAPSVSAGKLPRRVAP